MVSVGSLVFPVDPSTVPKVCWDGQEMGSQLGTLPAPFHPHIFVWYWAAQSTRNAGWMRAAEMLLTQQGILSP